MSTYYTQLADISNGATVNAITQINALNDNCDTGFAALEAAFNTPSHNTGAVPNANWEMDGASLRVCPHGIVQFVAEMLCTTGGVSTLVTLPSGYRPSKKLYATDAIYIRNGLRRRALVSITSAGVVAFEDVIFNSSYGPAIDDVIILNLQFPTV